MLKREKYIDSAPDLTSINFREWVDFNAATWPNNPAIRYRAQKKTEFDVWTHSRLRDEAYLVARMLLSSGLTKGSRVALWAENRPEWCAVWLGSLIAGLVIVPIDFALTEDDVSGILSLSEPEALFLSAKKAKCLERFLTERPEIRTSWILPDGSGPYERSEQELTEGTRSYLDMAGGTWTAELPPASSIAKEDPASIIFTSGTTGMAKGVTLSHYGIIMNANAAIRSLPQTPKDSFMGVLPLHHTYPTSCSFLAPLSAGGSCTICEKIIGKVILEDTRDSKSSVVIAVPLLLDKLAQGLESNIRTQKRPVKALLGALIRISHFFNTLGWAGFGKIALRSLRVKAGLGSVRLIVGGGGPLHVDTSAFFNDIGICTVQGYGMSENGPLISVNTEKYANNASVGLPVKHTEVRIDNAASDGIGEITVRSPSLMLGYYRNPEATKEIFTEDGWLRTGDLGYIDRKGFIFITGRSKNIIVSAGGKNIFPEELELKFKGITSIAEILILGRKISGSNAEEVIAVVYPDLDAIEAAHPGKSKDAHFVCKLIEGDVQDVNRQLPSYKKIVDVIIRDTEFEKNSSKKIRRFIYAKEYA